MENNNYEDEVYNKIRNILEEQNINPDEIELFKEDKFKKYLNMGIIEIKTNTLFCKNAYDYVIMHEDEDAIIINANIEHLNMRLLVHYIELTFFYYIEKNYDLDCYALDSYQLGYILNKYYDIKFKKVNFSKYENKESFYEICLYNNWDMLCGHVEEILENPKSIFKRNIDEELLKKFLIEQIKEFGNKEDKNIFNIK